MKKLDPMMLPKGIKLEPGRGYRASVHVRPFPLEHKRWPLHTPLAQMVEWLENKRTELRYRRQTDVRSTTRDYDPRARFAEDVEYYLRHVLSPTLHPDTRAQFERWLRKSSERFGRYPSGAISTHDWTTLLAEWERRGIPAAPGDGGRRRIVPPGPLSADTVNKIRVAWLGFYRGMYPDLPNPVRGVPRRTPTPPEPRGLPFATAMSIVNHIPPHTRTAARLKLMCLLGLRPVEIMRIQPHRDWLRAEQQLIVRTAKRGRPRTLPLSELATAALELLDHRQAWGTFTSAPAARMFHAAVRAAGLDHLEPLRPYDLRHSFGTEAYRQTQDIKATAAAMGHRNLSQTERYVEASVQENVTKVYDAIARVTPRPPKLKRQRGPLHEIK